MTPEWIAALASLAAVIVSIMALATSMRRATQHETDANNRALQLQVRALELDVAKNYMPRDQFGQEISNLTQRLEGTMKEIADKVEDLNRFLRRPQA